MADTCTLVTGLNALLTPVIACAVGYIAYRQWRTAHNKLRLDLFDKRLQVYINLRNFLIAFKQEERAFPNPAGELDALTFQGKFLFGENVAASISDIKKTIGGLEVNRRDSRELPHGSDRWKAAVAIQLEGEQWLKTLIESDLDKVLGPYLKVEA